MLIGFGTEVLECAQILPDAQALLAGDGPGISVETIQRVHILHVAVVTPLSPMFMRRYLLQLDIASADHSVGLLLFLQFARHWYPHPPLSVVTQAAL